MPGEEAQARGTGAGSQEVGQYPTGGLPGVELGTAATGQTKAEGPRLMEAVVERNNLVLAYQKVVRNGGAAGVDGLTVHDLKD